MEMDDVREEALRELSEMVNGRYFLEKEERGRRAVRVMVCVCASERVSESEIEIGE